MSTCAKYASVPTIRKTWCAFWTIAIIFTAANASENMLDLRFLKTNFQFYALIQTVKWMWISKMLSECCTLMRRSTSSEIDRWNSSGTLTRTQHAVRRPTANTWSCTAMATHRSSTVHSVSNHTVSNAAYHGTQTQHANRIELWAIIHEMITSSSTMRETAISNSAPNATFGSKKTKDVTIWLAGVATNSATNVAGKCHIMQRMDCAGHKDDKDRLVNWLCEKYNMHNFKLVY